MTMDLAEMSGRAAAVVTVSSHQLPVDKVVALAQLLRDEPVQGRFVGVGIESVSIGGEVLAEAVVAALPALRDAVARVVVDWTGALAERGPSRALLRRSLNKGSRIGGWAACDGGTRGRRCPVGARRP